MTDPTLAGHSGLMQPVADFATALGPADAWPASARAAEAGTFEQIYETWFDFVWRSLRRLGVSAASTDDAAQDVFLVVHRRLGEFQGRSSIKTWLSAIVLRVARDHRRAARRKPQHEPGCNPDALELLRDADRHDPLEAAIDAEAARLVHSLLDELDEDKRAVFVLAELEQMAVPEIARATDANVNTVYARLRAARRDFEGAMARWRARNPRNPRSKP